MTEDTERKEADAVGGSPLQAVVSPRCGNCAHIGPHGWGLPHDQKRCGKIKDRKSDFDSLQERKRIDAVDNFRFRPTDGVFPYSSAERCRHYERANAVVSGGGAFPPSA